MQKVYDHLPLNIDAPSKQYLISSKKQTLHLSLHINVLITLDHKVKL